MFGADLLPYVLPIHDAPDYRDQRGAVEPKYDKASAEENLKDYKIYHMNLCQLYLEDEVDDALDSDASLDLVILGLMYHPRFPSTFFNYIANQVPGMPIPQPEEVESFLEGNYGQNLQEVDCNYLSLILQLWSGRYTVLHYKNLTKALSWLKKKQQSLPHWPGGSIKAGTDKLAETKVNAESNKRRGERGLLPNEILILTKALEGVGLLDPATHQLAVGVGAGAVAGVINFLYKEKYISSSKKAAFRTLNQAFGLESSERSLYGGKRSTSIAKDYYDKTLSHFKKS